MTARSSRIVASSSMSRSTAASTFSIAARVSRVAFASANACRSALLAVNGISKRCFRSPNARPSVVAGLDDGRSIELDKIFVAPRLQPLDDILRGSGPCAARPPPDRSLSSTPSATPTSFRKRSQTRCVPRTTERS